MALFEKIEDIESRIDRFQAMLPGWLSQEQRERFWIGFTLGGLLTFATESAIEDAVKGAVDDIDGKALEA